MRETPADQAEAFNQHRKMLFSIAYRMLGSVEDAEDVVQETFVRWQQASGTEVRSPKSYLAAVVTRLCIDYLRSARVQREEYVGPWLPEPLPVETAPGTTDKVLLDESLSMAFLVLLESLTPVERAVFLLREVFGYEYGEISRIVDKSETYCRQMAHRSREYVAARRPRFEGSAEERDRITQRFVEACVDGDMDGLLALLSDDITVWSDGGGKVTTARNPIHGPEKVARYFLGLMSKAPLSFAVRQTRVNGQPGLVSYVDGLPMNVIALDVAERRIEAIRIVVNPEKLRAVPPLREEGGY